VRVPKSFLEETFGGSATHILRVTIKEQGHPGYPIAAITIYPARSASKGPVPVSAVRDGANGYTGGIGFPG
jgi:hypothetical protein